MFTYPPYVCLHHVVNFVLFGDFNAPHINWSLVSPVISIPINTQLNSIVYDSFLTQFVFVPTRQNHTLDLVFFFNQSHLLSDEVSLALMKAVMFSRILFSMVIFLGFCKNCHALSKKDPKIDGDYNKYLLLCASCDQTCFVDHVLPTSNLRFH